MDRVSGAEHLQVGADLRGAGLAAVIGIGAGLVRSVGDAGELAFDVGSAEIGPGKRPHPGLHARHKGEDGSDGAHSLITTWGRRNALEPVPWAQPKLDLGCMIELRHQALAPIRIPTWQILGARDGGGKNNYVLTRSEDRGSGGLLGGRRFVGRVLTGGGLVRGLGGGGRRRRMIGIEPAVMHAAVKRSRPPWGRYGPGGPHSGTWPGYARPGSRNGRRGRDGGRRCRGRRAIAG